MSKRDVSKKMAVVDYYFACKRWLEEGTGESFQMESNGSMFLLWDLWGDKLSSTPKITWLYFLDDAPKSTELLEAECETEGMNYF